jgi:2-methylcitrate dehydratase PrpD
MGHAVRRLAGWACALELADIPETVRHAAGNALVDTVAVAIAGSRTAVATRARRIAHAAYGGGQASLLGAEETLNAPGAALANGAAAHALDFDDNCYAGFVHGSAVIMPAVLATAEAEGASGADLLTAFVAGCEAEFAAGAAATATLYEKGWWTTGVLGPVGASIAAAHVLGLNAEMTACALGLAVAGTGGSKACFGTDGKPVLCGRAAESGVVAALMAGAGVTGPWNAFEDSRGFAALFNGGIFDADAFEMLGSGWRILDPGIDIKRVPVCLSAHAALDAVMDLMAEHRIAAEEIGRVVCDVGPIVTANLVYNDPSTPQQAQFSMPFVIGCMLVHGDVGLAQIAPESLADSRVRAAMRLVEMVTTARWDACSEEARRYPEGAFVTVETRDGRSWTRFNGFARGTRARPLSNDEIGRKFMSCVEPVLGGPAAEALLTRLRRVETLPDARYVLRQPA